MLLGLPAAAGAGRLELAAGAEARARMSIARRFERYNTLIDELFSAVSASSGGSADHSLPSAEARGAGDSRGESTVPLSSISSSRTQVGTGGSHSGPASDRSEALAYRVRRGESLWKIARRFYGSGAAVKFIKRVNRLSSDFLREGQILVLPPKSDYEAAAKGASEGDGGGRRRAEREAALPRWARVEGASGFGTGELRPLNYEKYDWKIHQVRPGETFSSIAERYYGDPSRRTLLLKYNDAGAIRRGKVLVPLPKSARVRRRYLLSRRGIFE